MKNGHRQETAICEFRIENNQKHLIMWLSIFHCLREANVKPHSFIIYLGLSRRAYYYYILSMAMICKFSSFQIFKCWFFVCICHSRLSLSSLDLFIGPFDCTMWSFFITRTHKRSSARNYYHLWRYIFLLLLHATQFSNFQAAFTENRFLETDKDYPNIISLIAA